MKTIIFNVSILMSMSLFAGASVLSEKEINAGKMLGLSEGETIDLLSLRGMSCQRQQQQQPRQMQPGSSSSMFGCYDKCRDIYHISHHICDDYRYLLRKYDQELLNQ